MFDALRQFGDRLLGRGSAAITVPVMDGALKPNRVLDEAEVIASLEGIDDLVTDGRTLFATAGPVLYRLEDRGLVEMARFDADISALAAHAADAIAVAVAGKQVHVMSPSGGEWGIRATLDRIGDVALNGVNALHFESDDGLLMSDGSTRNGPAAWSRDLMEKGCSGRVARWRSGEKAELLAERLQFAYGVLALNDEIIFSESWRHRVVRADGAGAGPLLADLVGYPSRMSLAAGGGFWLSCFVCRTQLVEFILREDAYRARMLKEIEPGLWVAPALRSGASFLEPLQGAGVKQMGVLKPWAPPRAYGLVLRVDAAGRILRSLHSQVDGRHHGITAVAEFGGMLHVASKGSGKLLRVPLQPTGDPA